jgi:hypothetical protein
MLTESIMKSNMTGFDAFLQQPKKDGEKAGRVPDLNGHYP